MAATWWKRCIFHIHHSDVYGLKEFISLGLCGSELQRNYSVNRKRTEAPSELKWTRKRTESSFKWTDNVNESLFGCPTLRGLSLVRLKRTICENPLRFKSLPLFVSILIRFIFNIPFKQLITYEVPPRFPSFCPVTFDWFQISSFTRKVAVIRWV